MGSGEKWTKEECERLAEEWGAHSIPTIAKNHNRSINAIINKARRMGLGSHLGSSQYITLNSFFKEIGIGGGYTYTLSIFIQAGLKIHNQKVNNNSFKMIDIDEFWAFAEKNRHLIDFSRFDEGALGKEPEWVSTKRREDSMRAANIQPHNAEWTKAEDLELLRLLKAFKYTYVEISERLHRSEGAIQRRVLDLGIKERPIKADNHNLWTDEQLQDLCEMIKIGSNYENMRSVIGKSAKAIRGKVYACYLTENLNQVRNIIGEGNFGDNRPERLIKQRNYMTLEEKSEVKSNISSLAGLIAYRARQHFDGQDNWQRNLCQNWDEIKGCTAQETNCDTCASFQRIRAQYCARCGATFYERQENRMCTSCRVQRKKLGYKKYLRSQNKTKARISL